MADLLREMDPAHRAFLAIGIAVFIRVLLSGWWDRFKQRQATKEQPMRLRNGVYEQYGIVQRIEGVGRFFLWVWAIWMLIMIAMLIYMKWNGWDRLF